MEYINQKSKFVENTSVFRKRKERQKECKVREDSFISEEKKSINRYWLVFAKQEMLEQCKTCGNDSDACCKIGCEVFDRVVEAIDEGLTEMNPCFNCPHSKTQCYGWENGKPNPIPPAKDEEDEKEAVEAMKEYLEVADDTPKEITEFRGQYHFLSNFYESVFVVGGIEFKTVEHFFQALKCVNRDEMLDVINAPTPGKARSIGRRVELKDDWKDIKVSVMYAGLKEKFKNTTLRKLLINTGDKVLKEGNTWNDTYWGVNQQGKGKNVLGRLLMKLRSEIKEEEVSKCRYYTGIGSRKTPINILNKMSEISKAFDNAGFTLRSGGAPGADSAFEKTAKEKEVFLPWKGFNDKSGIVPEKNDKALKLAEKFHPNWHNLNDTAKKFMIRNVYQVLGKDLNTPSEFVICWTPDGAESDYERSIKTGGTGFAISLADSLGIPVYNLANADSLEKVRTIFTGLV
jgi:ribA/ribD-fused uncharacterized protein